MFSRPARTGPWFAPTLALPGAVAVASLLALLAAACGAPRSHTVLRPDPDAGVEDLSGLPLLVTHPPSGVRLRLVPPTAAEPAFYLAETELTVGSWRRFVAQSGYRTDAERGVPDDRYTIGAFSALPSGGREWSEQASWQRIFPLLGTEQLREDLPALYLSAADAEAYAAHFGLRLPTASEWERAARAGAQTRYPWGDDPADAGRYANLQDRAGARRFPEFNVPLSTDDGFALVAPAASLQPNAWGFFDLVGNVEEWCSAGSGAGEQYLLTGGSWVADADGATLTQRASLPPHARRDFIGFRPALSIAPR